MKLIGITKEVAALGLSIIEAIALVGIDTIPENG